MKRSNLKNVLVALVTVSILISSCSKDDDVVVGDRTVYGDGLTDIDGNIYQSVIIGNQEWMAENLKVTHYTDGVIIPHAADGVTWGTLNYYDHAYCWYNDDVSNKNIYGALYTYEAAQNACPTGWHLPSQAEWLELKEYLTNNGLSGEEGSALKTISGWNGDNEGTDNYGFAGLPAGHRYSGGRFYNKGEETDWWTSTERDSQNVWYFTLNYSSSMSSFVANKEMGYSVRCIKDSN